MIAEKAGIDGSELLKQTSAHAAAETSGSLTADSSSSSAASLVNVIVLIAFNEHVENCKFGED